MKKIFVQSETLKWFALFAMTMDHIDKVFAHTGWISNTIGRMAFPIFAYLLISNFCLYHPVKKYIKRLAFWGIFTQIILLPAGFSNNILFTFLYAILFISFVEELCKNTKSFWWQTYFSVFFFLILFPFILISDYSLMGFFFLIALYACIKKKTKLSYSAVLLTTACINTGSILEILFSLFPIICLLSFIKIKGSKRFTKWWFFYLYYPLHRVFLYFLKALIG